MPLWTLEELQKLRSCVVHRRKCSTEEVVKRCKIWGGIPRYIFSNTKPGCIHSEIKGLTPSVLQGLSWKINTATQVPSGSHKILHVNASKDEDGEYDNQFIAVPTFHRLWRQCL